MHLQQVYILIYREELSKYEGLVDVIIGDLCDPDAFSLSMNLYTKDFYESVVKQKLKSDGIFVTQVSFYFILFLT